MTLRPFVKEHPRQYKAVDSSSRVFRIWQQPQGDWVLMTFNADTMTNDLLRQGVSASELAAHYRQHVAKD